MNHDVDDPEQGLGLEKAKPDDGRALFNRQKSPILSRIRNFNNLAISSIGSAFSGPLSAMSSYVLQDSPTTPISEKYDDDMWDTAYDLEAGRPNIQNQQGSPYNTYYSVETSTPTQTRSNSPLQSGRLSDIKRIFNNFARSRNADTHVQMHATNSSSMEGARHDTKSYHQYANLPPLYPPSESSWDEPSGTPPLTPDSFEDIALPSPVLPGDYGYEYDDEDDAMEIDRSHSHSLEVKEGKKPERVNCYDILIEDARNTTSNDAFRAARNRPSATRTDDRDEWYGLEYTLELSCRERHPSDSTKSAGEHSRSRESWAAIHQGSIHPFFEDEDYYQWKNWHRYLDQLDERRKHKRGWEFKACSKDLAWFYAEEMRTRDVMYWQKEVYGVVAREVKKRINSLAEHRPDPYSPAQEHGLGWYLKRSRSVACLRELRPLSALNLHKVRTYEYDDDTSSEEELSIDDSMFLED